MGSLVPWLLFAVFGSVVALALMVLGLRDAIRAAVLGYSVVLLAGFLPIVVGRWAPSPTQIIPAVVASVIFAMPGILLSVLGAAILRKFSVVPRRAYRVMPIAIGVVLGIIGGLVVAGPNPMVAGWVPLTVGTGVGACWGVLAPSVIRPNKPLQPTSGGQARGGSGSMGDAARG